MQPRPLILALAFSTTFGAAAAALAAEGTHDHGGGMAGAGPADLRHTDAASQVASLRHCRTTYTVRTAAGKTLQFGEFNVRLKTDASDRGPAPGKPVMTASGMRGDRVSIVFASPAELGRFIQEACD